MVSILIKLKFAFDCDVSEGVLDPNKKSTASVLDGNEVNVEWWSFNVVTNFNCRSHLDFEQTGYRMKSGSGVAPSSIYEYLPVSIYEPKSFVKK